MIILRSLQIGNEIQKKASNYITGAKWANPPLPEVMDDPKVEAVMLEAGEESMVITGVGRFLP